MFQVTNSLSEVLYNNITYTGIVMDIIINARVNIGQKNIYPDQYHLLRNVLIRISTSDNEITLNRRITHINNQKKVFHV